jgi:hypothetical protein
MWVGRTYASVCDFKVSSRSERLKSASLARESDAQHLEGEKEWNGWVSDRYYEGSDTAAVSEML